MASGVEINVSSGHPHYRRSKGILVAAQCRAYHADCFEAIRPLLKAPGWDTIDVAEAAVRGWRTVVVEEATFVHHREIGARDGSRRQVHLCEGVEAHRLRYRPWYLILRSLHQSMHDPAAIVQIGGYLASVAKQSDALGSPEARALLREQQRFRHLTARLKEASLDRRLRRGGLLLVANPGGHLRELVALRDVWQQWTPRVWALVDTTSAPLGESVYRLAGPTPRSVRALGLNLLRAVRVMLIERPRVWLTTGAATAVPFVWVAWLFRTEIIFLECSGRIGLSLSGKLCRPFATHYFVQGRSSRMRRGGWCMPGVPSSATTDASISRTQLRHSGVVDSSARWAPMAKSCCSTAPHDHRAPASPSRMRRRRRSLHSCGGRRPWFVMVVVGQSHWPFRWGIARSFCLVWQSSGRTSTITRSRSASVSLATG